MKKSLCIILCIALMLTSFAFSAFADDEAADAPKQLSAAEGYFSDWEYTGAVRSLDSADFMEGEGCYSFEGSDMTIGANFTDIS